MNRRIKKKDDKRLCFPIVIFDLNNESMIPPSRSYRDIRTHRRRNHEYLIRRIYLDFGFNKRLTLKRTMYRKDYFKAMKKRFNEKHFKEEN
jgi:hypothetical protein